MNSKWPAAAVAIALILMIGGISVAAILEYSVDDALKIWSGLTGVVGIVTGGAATYFFTRGEAEKKDAALQDIKQALPDDKVDELRQRPAVSVSGW
jgi:hypothetical protein